MRVDWMGPLGVAAWLWWVWPDVLYSYPCYFFCWW